MINIRPVSDLRNKYPEVEKDLLTTGEPIILTKNGYGSMVIMTIERYAQLTDAGFIADNGPADEKEKTIGSK